MKLWNRIALAMVGMSLFVLQSGCAKNAEEERKDRQEQATRREMTAEVDGGGNANERAAVRKTATDYMQTKLPVWSVQGVSMFAYTGNLFLVGVDAKSASEQRTYNLVTRLFVSPDGKTYWKAEPFTSDLAAVLSGHTLLRYRSQLADQQNTDSPDYQSND